MLFVVVGGVLLLFIVVVSVGRGCGSVVSFTVVVLAIVAPVGALQPNPLARPA